VRPQDKPEKIEWEAYGTQGYDECYRTRQAMIKKNIGSPDDTFTTTGGYITFRKDPPMSMEFSYYCLPDTVDPRGSKGR
jgi:hypothetical protein